MVFYFRREAILEGGNDKNNLTARIYNSQAPSMEKRALVRRQEV